MQKLAEIEIMKVEKDVLDNGINNGVEKLANNGVEKLANKGGITLVELELWNSIRMVEHD